MNDRDRLIALLGSLDDLSPQPETSAGNLQRRNEVPRKFAPVVQVPCPTCGDNPTPGRLGSLRPCTNCGGTGDDAGRGWIWIDPYDKLAREVGGEGGATAPSTVEIRCLQCEDGTLPNGKPCVYCRGSGELTRFAHTVDLASGQAVPIENPEVRATDAEEVVLAGILSRDRYSYGALDRALADLYREWKSGARLVVAVHVEHARQPGPREQITLDEALVWLLARMPTPILIPPWLERGVRLRDRREFLHRARNGNAAALRAERDREIRELREEFPVEAIVRMTGLQKSAIYEALSREAARRAGIAA